MTDDSDGDGFFEAEKDLRKAMEEEDVRSRRRGPPAPKAGGMMRKFTTRQTEPAANSQAKVGGAIDSRTRWGNGTE